VKAALLILVVVTVIGAIGGVVVGEAGAAEAFAGIWDGLLSGGAMIVGAATVAGFIIERQPNKPEFMTQWRVKDLELFRRWSLNGDGLMQAAGGGAAGAADSADPTTARTRTARRKRGVVATALWCVAAWAVFVLWWVGGFELSGLNPQQLLAAFGSMFPGVDYGEALSGLVQPLYWPVIAYGLARMALELARAAAPGAVRPAAVGDLILALVGAGFLYWIWTQSALAPVAQIDSLDGLIDRTVDLFQGRFDLAHVLVLILIFNAVEIVGRVIGALRRLTTGRA
jgi:hypothetical protein